MANAPDEKAKKKDPLVLVSFKISKDIYKELERYALTQADDAGVCLSASLAARRLMIRGLKRIQRIQQKKR
ncbi:MAG: hypothetical protein AB7F43_07685 [Bacteriovoracia bacterium]